MVISNPWFLFCFGLLHHMACGIVVPPSGIEPTPRTSEACSLNHWTVGKVPVWWSLVASVLLLMELFHAFLRLSNIPLCIWTTFLYPFIFDGHLGCFPVSAILNGAAMNVGVHICFLTQFCPDLCPGAGFLGHTVVLFPVFWRTSILFPVGAVQTYSTTDSVGENCRAFICFIIRILHKISQGEKIIFCFLGKKKTTKLLSPIVY